MHDQVGAVGLEESPANGSLLQIASGFTAIETDAEAFGGALSEVAAFQRVNVPTYGRYCASFPDVEAPFLPIQAFKRGPLIAGGPEAAEVVFLSSGTGGQRSRHYVRSVDVYKRSFTSHFESVFGSGPFTLAAHLPRYADLADASSLVFMVRGLIEKFGDSHSGFFLDDVEFLEDAITFSESEQTPLILFGASFGLLDLLKSRRWNLPGETIIVETGGLKTRDRQTDQQSLHAALADGFGIGRSHVWSEYGMCELLSQFYTRGGDVFLPPAWARFDIRSIDNPLRVAKADEPGLLAIVDLANMFSVSAVLTEDLAVREGSGFRLLGRLKGADLRGCNLLLEGLE